MPLLQIDDGIHFEPWSNVHWNIWQIYNAVVNADFKTMET